MAEYTHLIGAEEVQQAGFTMSTAAAEMQCAASQISEALHTHRRFMDDWLLRLDATLSDRSHDFWQAAPRAPNAEVMGDGPASPARRPAP